MHQKALGWFWVVPESSTRTLGHPRRTRGPDEGLPAPELPAELNAQREEAKELWHSEEEESPLPTIRVTLQLHHVSGLAGHGRE